MSILSSYMSMLQNSLEIHKQETLIFTLITSYHVIRPVHRFSVSSCFTTIPYVGWVSEHNNTQKELFMKNSRLSCKAPISRRISKWF